MRRKLTTVCSLQIGYDTDYHQGGFCDDGRRRYRRSVKCGMSQDDEAVFVKDPRRINVIASESDIIYQTVSSAIIFEVGRESVPTVTFCAATAVLQKFYSTSAGAWGDRQERAII